MPQLLIGTTNTGKITEFNSILQQLLPRAIDTVSLSHFLHIDEILENGKTFSENAALKALHFAKATNIPTLADDSGLVVDALQGEPGIFSARYAANDERTKPSMHDNIKKLLHKLRHTPMEQRSARYTAALCLAFPDETMFHAEAHWEGSIALCEVGSNGFGYDPIFICKEYNCSVASLEPEIKNTLSHRRKALIALIERHGSTIFSKLLDG